MGLEPVLTYFEYCECPINSLFWVGFIVLVNIITLFLQIADMSLAKMFTIILEFDIEDSIVID